MCACSYYALFKINIDNKYFQFNYNKLVAGATTGAALMQARRKRGKEEEGKGEKGRGRGAARVEGETGRTARGRGEGEWGRC